MSPKTWLPLLSESASGQIGKTLVFYRRLTKNHVRAYGAPNIPTSALQLQRQEVVSDIRHDWWALTPEQRQAWNAAAEATGKPWWGYIYFLKLYVPHRFYLLMESAFFLCLESSDKIIFE